MKKLFLVLVCLLGICKAQDQLFMKDNSRLLVKITEITPDEIKYKLYNNQNGPVYVISKQEAVMLIYENGKHEVINNDMGSYALPVKAFNGMKRSDSLSFFKYRSNIALNFFGFANGEVGLIFQREFYKSNFNLVVPFAFGIQKPGLTQSIYYGNNYNGLKLDHKLFEVGIGINYYPTLKYPINYYIGPTIKYMQFACQQAFSYRDPNSPPNTYNQTTIVKNSILSSYCYSVTNGLIFRTRSRLMLNLFGSIGFRSDELNNRIIDPVYNVEVQTIRSPINIYFWAGFAVGYCF